MQTTSIEVRDQRGQEWYWTNNEFIDRYGEIVGTHAIAVYAILCRHANNSTQKCFPSMDLIGRKTGIRSRKTVSKAIDVLESFHIIEIEKGQAEDGKRLNNIYRLTKPSSWKVIKAKVNFKVVDLEDIPAPGTELFEVSIVAKGDLPEWLNKDAWAQWEKHRKEIKKKLTPLTIRQQLKFLESHQADHVAIIENSIMNGWTGLFAIKGKAAVKKIEAPTGKYSHISK